MQAHTFWSYLVFMHSLGVHVHNKGNFSGYLSCPNFYCFIVKSYQRMVLLD